MDYSSNHGISRRNFLALSGSAGMALAVRPFDGFAGIGTKLSGHNEYTEGFKVLLEQLRVIMLDAFPKSLITMDQKLHLHSPSVSATYRGIWPDDFLYPMLVQSNLYKKETLSAIAEFLTTSVVDLPCFPDRIEADGMPVMQPGWLSAPHAQQMPLHLPATWIRVMDHLEKWGAVIPRKAEWAAVFQRSLEMVPYSCGLAYVDPQRPGVEFGFHDTEAITGFVLMTSVVHYFGLNRAVRFFQGHVAPAVIQKWKQKATAISMNLYRLFDDKEGAFLAGSKDCRQVNVWGNGLAYWISSPSIQKSIVNFYRRNRKEIFLNGFTRQITEPDGWKRLLVNIPVGSYQNGGFWPYGTGLILPAIEDQDPAFALEIATEMVDNIKKSEMAEWTDSKGAGGASGYLASVAAPMMALTAIIEKRPFVDYF